MIELEQSKLMMGGRMEVHTDGTIYRIKSDGSKVLAVQVKNGRYKTVSMQISGKQKSFYVHRLVAEAFIPNPDDKPNVRHKDGNNTNNHVDNLKWTDRCVQASSTWDNRRAPCQICGRSTCTENHICRSCKTKEKNKNLVAKNKDRKKVDIEDAMNQIDMTLLTPQELETVALRKQYLSYVEIGELLGCSRQCVEQRLKNATQKSLLGPKPKKMVLKKRVSVESRLSRLKSKRCFLENQLAILTADIEFNEKKLALLENETPTAATVRASGN